MCRCVWSRNFKNEAMARVGPQRHRGGKIVDQQRLFVKIGAVGAILHWKSLQIFFACFLQFRADCCEARRRRFPQKCIQHLRISWKSERGKPPPPNFLAIVNEITSTCVHRAATWHSVSKERLPASRNATPPILCSCPAASNGFLNCCPVFCPDTRAQNRLPGHCVLFLLNGSSREWAERLL